MRLITLLFVLTFSYPVLCQVNIINLKKIVKEGICTDESKSCVKKQILYLNACKDLGEYYYKKQDYKTALKYFLLPYELGTYTDGELQENYPIKLRNTIVARAGSMYFHGIGVKKNIKKAFALHHFSPTFYTETQKSNYSKLYFKNVNEFYEPDTVYTNVDSPIIFGINPFFITNDITAKRIVGSIKNKIFKTKNDSLSKCIITLTYGEELLLNIANQADLQHLLRRITTELNEILGYPISSELIISEDGFLYQRFTLPRLSITLK